MPDFPTLQSQVRDAEATIETGKRDVFLAGERVKQLEARKRQVSRSHGTDSDAWQQLDAAQAEWRESIASGRDRLAAAFDLSAGLYRQFEPFLDPRSNLERLSDQYTILLLPVRLETRFKTVEVDDDTRQQLWVRIFPDECSIDTFDDVLSVSEITRARNYWAAVWRAGTAANAAMEPLVRDKRLGAWQKLMGQFNAGRAHWVTETHKPQNVEPPPRSSASDQILVIVTDSPPSPAEQTALQTYWTAAYLAGGDVAAVEAALADLVTATGSEQAATALIAAYTPANFDEPPDEIVDSPSVAVEFLVFDADVDVKLTAWSQAARVRTFPEKFVLLGFQGNDAAPVVNELGARIPNPLIVGPDTRDEIEAVLAEAYADFDSLSDEEKAARYVEYLSEHADTRWLFDFDRAVAMGLGFKVDLTAAQFRQGFTRLMVVGIKLGADETAARTALEELLHNHQMGDAGFGFVPQGTPTNNTEEQASGNSVREDAVAAFERYHGTGTPAPPPSGYGQRDGRHFARVLGIDPDAAALATAENYYSEDQIEARAMHTALWNATLGYYLESMVTPVSSDSERDIVREYLRSYVRGRGTLPAIRIGHQPYGILPVSDLRNLKWLTPSLPAFGRDQRTGAVLTALYNALNVMRSDMAGVLQQVAFVGKRGGADAHEILLQALGLHAGSVEFDRRIAQSFDQIKNQLYAQGVLGDDIDNLDVAHRQAGLQLLQRLGYNHDNEEDPPIPVLTRAFSGLQEDVDKPLIDDRPLSEERLIRAYTDAGLNYIEWLIEHANNDHRIIRAQSDFTDNQRPVALLYDLLRHALNLEFANASLKLYRLADVLTASEVMRSRIDPPFIGVQVDNEIAESKWDLIYREDARVAPAGMVIADHLSELVRTNVMSGSTHQLREMIEALDILKHKPTARLERCLVEHLDCCHYRLDAWLLGFLNLQLDLMRQQRRAGGGEIVATNTSAAAPPRDTSKGIYLGAYGWVENLQPENKQLEPADLDDEQQEIFDPDGLGDIVTDSKNAGFLHAPSIAHGLTATVLRNAYISTASEDNPEQYKVNLSSERVRAALSIIEGMQQGQGLAELLGYRLERGLHDNNDEELDIFIYELRKVFSLASNRLKLTAIKAGKVATNALESVRFAEEAMEFEEDRAITKIEARNVVNGLALLEHIKKNKIASYPFGFETGSGADKLRAATDDERAAIDAEVRKLMNVRDAVADLAIAEAVHQAVQGNYDRAAGTLDAYSKGQFPPTPDVVQSAMSGAVLTHRFGIHLPAGVSPNAGTTPMAKAEPAVNAWLADLFPPAGQIRCTVRFRTPIYEGEVENPWSEIPVTLADLDLEPIDLLYLYDADSQKNLSALDDHVLRVFRDGGPARADLDIEIDYTTPVGADFTFFQLGAMLAELRELVVAARALEPSDLALQNEASKGQNTTATIADERIVKAKAPLDGLLGDLESDVIDVLDPLLDLEDTEVGVGNFAALAAAFDGVADNFAAHTIALARFRLTGAGSAFLHARERAVSAGIYEQVLACRLKWDDYASRYTDIVNNRLPAAADDDARIALWHEAEALISATTTTDFADVPALQAVVEAKKILFDGMHGQIGAFMTTDFATLAAQYTAADALIAGLDPFDLQPLEIVEQRRALVTLAEDLLNQSQKLHATATAVSSEVQDTLDNLGTLAPDKHLPALQEAAKRLLGEDFVALPEFKLSAEQTLEVQNCLADQAQLLDHQRNTLDVDFPVDDWLYGVARVRGKAASWENLTMLAEAFDERPPLELTPLQLPYRPDDSWLALSYPETRTLDGDNLLYTAYAPALDPTQPQVGLLVDEWTEVIPAEQETTAMTFHYDRPNCEPPQSMLLVTPPEFTGAWAFDNVVAAMHEALELARLRALEPDLIDQTDYTRFLPATVATITVFPVTMALNFGVATAVAVDS
ncbi:MAG: hypothetical protein ACREQ8_18030 [Woeseiaceae bacterium]